MHNLILTPISVDALTEKIALKTLEFLEQKKQTNNTHNPDELLTREQTCNFLQIDSSTLWHWTNKGKVIAYGIGNRRYYKKAEILECLTPLKK
jgi:hypothetical protein